MSTPNKSDTDYLDNALELDGPALESCLADLERDEPHMAQRIRAALAMRETPEFEAVGWMWRSCAVDSGCARAH